jgi:predicted enzyme related to lactoylglutathione lyase
VHFEIPADDLQKMKDFYHDVFGWKFMDVLGMNYTVVHTVPTDDDGMLLEPGVNGGMLKRTMPQQVPINYIQV